MVISNPVLEKIIDLIFDKHCEMKEVAYHQDALVCDDLMELKAEIKECVLIYLEQHCK